MMYRVHFSDSCGFSFIQMKCGIISEDVKYYAPDVISCPLSKYFDFTDTTLLRLKGTFGCHLAQPPAQGEFLCGDDTGHTVRKAILWSRKGITTVLPSSIKPVISS